MIDQTIQNSSHRQRPTTHKNTQAGMLACSYRGVNAEAMDIVRDSQCQRATLCRFPDPCRPGEAGSRRIGVFADTVSSATRWPASEFTISGRADTWATTTKTG